jgi:ribosomal protein L37AE/L43A
MNINNIINDLSLVSGETKRMTCPSCNTKNTFTVTNNMGSVVWNCYKASCSLSGGTNVSLTADDIRKSLGFVAEETHVATFVKPEWLVRDYRTVKDFCAEWSLNPQDLGLLYDVREHRVVFPVMHGGVMVDATGRSLGKRLPKWKRYGKSHLPYVSGRGKTAVVVEDCISAAVVGDGDVCVGVAVLGTSLSIGHKEYLSQFSTAIIALDPDALPKTLQFAKELRGYVDTVKVLRLTDDLKYREPTDMANLSTLGE